MYVISIKGFGDALIALWAINRLNDNSRFRLVTAGYIAPLICHLKMEDSAIILSNIKNYPEIFNEIISDGHSIGNHTQNHLNGWKTTTENYIANVLECHKTIAQFKKLKINESNIIILRQYFFRLTQPSYHQAFPCD